MKFLSIAIFLIVLEVSLCKEKEYKFEFSLPLLNYTFNGIGYDSIDWLKPSAEIKVPFNGTFMDKPEVNHPMSGEITMDQPFLTHLSTINVQGKVESDGNLTFKGVFKVGFFDLFKRNVPFKGNMSFSDGKEGEGKGIVFK